MNGNTLTVNKDFYKKYMEVFLRQNSKLNLVSQNDEKFLWEKHIYDSLAIGFFLKKTGFIPKKLLDIGTGGGFPAIPIALAYPEIDVYALDSVRKKINAIEIIKQELKIENLHTICNRAEDLNEKFDLITSRAAASLKILCGYALPLLNNGGYLIAYKSRKAKEEIKDAEIILKKFNAKIADIIVYELPIEEIYTRNLIVIELF